MAGTSTTQYNSSNKSATAPDTRFSNIQGGVSSTETDITSAQGTPGVFGTESGPTIINRRDAEDQQSAAIEAERQWLARVSDPEQNAPERNNKIRLVSTLLDNGPMEGTVNTGLEQIEFDLSPDISESKQVIYAEIGDIREAASLMIYGGSPSRKWSINAKFLARTGEEANNTWKKVQLLRSWTNPDRNYKYGFDRSVPRVLRLHGYGRTWKGIPVVITSLNVEYPSDVDYIPAEAIAEAPVVINGQNLPDGTTLQYGTLVPVIQTVSIQLTEIRTPEDLSKKYNLEKFKLGVLDTW